LAEQEERDTALKAQARTLARKGRGGDTEIAHVTPGEIVLPPALQTPEVMAALDWAAAGMGVSLDRLRVGARGNAINPQTGKPEFASDEVFPMEEILVRGKAMPSDLGDLALLARMIFAEAAREHNVPGLYERIGWTAMNRVGKPTFPNTLDGVIHHRDHKGVPQFSSIDDNLWKEAEDPSKLTGPNVAAYQRARDTAAGILAGKIPDPTEGGQYFFSGNPSPFFMGRIQSGRLAPIGEKYGPFTFLRDTELKPRGH